MKTKNTKKLSLKTFYKNANQDQYKEYFDGLPAIDFFNELNSLNIKTSTADFYIIMSNAIKYGSEEIFDLLVEKNFYDHKVTDSLFYLSLRTTSEKKISYFEALDLEKNHKNIVDFLINNLICLSLKKQQNMLLKHLNEPNNLDEKIIHTLLYSWYAQNEIYIQKPEKNYIIPYYSTSKSICLYDFLFKIENPEAMKKILNILNEIKNLDNNNNYKYNDQNFEITQKIENFYNSILEKEHISNMINNNINKKSTFKI